MMPTILDIFVFGSTMHLDEIRFLRKKSETLLEKTDRGLHYICGELVNNLSLSDEQRKNLQQGLAQPHYAKMLTELLNASLPDRSQQAFDAFIHDTYQKLGHKDMYIPICKHTHADRCYIDAYNLVFDGRKTFLDRFNSTFDQIHHVPRRGFVGVEYLSRKMMYRMKEMERQYPHHFTVSFLLCVHQSQATIDFRLTSPSSSNTLDFEDIDILSQDISSFIKNLPQERYNLGTHKPQEVKHIVDKLISSMTAYENLHEHIKKRPWENISNDDY